MHTSEPPAAAEGQGQREHGTRLRYAWGPSQDGQRGRGCRCADCTEANRADHAHRERMIAYGRWQPFVDAGPAREHIRALGAAGIGWRRAAELAGLSASAVGLLLYGRPGRDGQPPSRRIRPETEQKILAVRPGLETLGGGAVVDATGARRRLQALVAAGHSQARLGERLGITPSNMSTVMSSDRLTAGTVRAVRDLYDEMWNVPPDESGHRSKGSASRARNYARERGWAPALAWDEEEIDKPDGKPAEGWRPTGRTSVPAAALAENAEFVREHDDYRQATNAQVAERLGVSRERLEKALERTRAREATASQDRELEAG